MQKATLHQCLYLLVILAAFGCKKTSTVNEGATTEKLYSIVNGRVAFTSAVTYTQFLETATDAQKMALAAELQRQPGYTPLSKSPTARQTLLRSRRANRLAPTGNAEIDDDIADILASPMLGNMINADGIVQIGSYVYSIDMLAEKCYALHTDWLSGASGTYYYNLLLSGNASNIYVFEFTTDDDVLEILTEAGNPTTNAGINISPDGLFCSEKQAKKRKTNGTEILIGPKTPNDFVKCKVVYQKGGIYFALLGKMTYDLQADGHNWESLQSYYNWQFKPRCWNERIQPPVKDVIPGQSSHYKNYAWESSRALTKFKIQFQWYLIGDAFWTNSLPHLTKVYAIQYGY